LTTAFAQAFAFRFDVMSIVNEGEGDGVGNCGIADDVMPVVKRWLAMTFSIAWDRS
jgi:hypothetical protein